MSDWITIGCCKPPVHHPVIYYFEQVGVHRGKYYRTVVDTDEKYPVQYHDCFHGAAGWLTDDVTHWMLDTGQELPEPPNDSV